MINKGYRLVFIALMIIVSTVQGFSQITLNGMIKGNNEPLSFANIALFVSSDSINPIKGTLSDLNGLYKFTNLSPGKYVVKISYVGYSDYTAVLRLRMPSGGNSIERDFELQPVSKVLQEVQVYANPNTVYADHTKYRFSSEQRARARHSADLLENVSDLTIDPITGTVTKLSGGNVGVLINGLTSSITDLKSIPADKIRYVEYYTIPSARYSNTTAVINVITKTLDSGVNGGVDISHAVTAGFFNDDVFVRTINGNNQFVLNYQVHYRNYRDRFVNEAYSYHFDKNTINYESKSHNKFGYTTHIPTVKYIYFNPESFSFQATIKPEYETMFDNATSEILIKNNDGVNSGSGVKTTDSKYFGPSLDLYLSKKFKNETELAANIVSTYFLGNLNSSAKEVFSHDNSSLFNDNMSRETRKFSSIGELFYMKRLGLNALSVGYKYTLSQATAIGKNILTDYNSTKYESDYLSNYIYGEYSGVFDRVKYRISLGGTYISSSTSKSSYDHFYLAPQIVLDWSVKGNHHVSLSSKSQPIIPTLSQLSDNAEYVTSQLIHTGNPMLKSGISYINLLGYRYTGSVLDMTLGLTYNFDNNPIEWHYSPEVIHNQDYIIARAENGKKFIQYGGVLSAKLNLLSDKFSVRVVSMALEQQLRSKTAQWTRNLYIPTFIQLAYNTQKWGVNYKCNLPSNQISGMKLVLDENVSSLNTYFQYKKVRLSASCQWFLTKAKYKERILDNKSISHVSTSWIDDNKSMFIIGFSWNFSHGKHSEYDQKLNNSDTDKGTF